MTVTRPKLSVMIYCFNHRAFIERAVRSVLEQQVSFPLEVLIGDDASTDGTPDRLRALCAGHEQVQLIVRDNNVGAARNFYDLLERCHGDYVAFLDGDDYWTSPDKLAKQVAALDAHTAWSLCCHRVEHVAETGRSLGVFYPEKFPAGYGFRELLEHNLLQMCTVVLRRDRMPQVSEVVRRLVPGDWPLFLLLAERGEIGFLPEVMAAYRLHANSGWSAKPRWQRELATLQMLLTMQDEVRPEHRSLVREACEQRFREIHDCTWHLKLRREIGARFGIEGLIKSVREFPWPWRSARP
jgi:glycosyltransferase involved in cell wall biosynthesis